jgi:hypothetical protein
MADPVTNPQSASPTPQAGTPPPSAPPDDSDKVVAATLAHPSYKNASPEEKEFILKTLKEKYVTSRTPGGTGYRNLPPELLWPDGSNTLPRLRLPSSGIAEMHPMNETDVLNTLGGTNLNESDLAKDPAKITEALPALGAMIATFGEAGFLKAILRAFGGGAAGGAVSQTAKVAAKSPDAPRTAGEGFQNSMEAGAQQSGTEALGRVLMWPLRKVMGGVMENEPASSAEIADKKFKLGLTPGQQTGKVVPRSMERMAEHNVAGFSTAEPYREAIDTRAGQAAEGITARSFGSSPNDMAGSRVQSAITDLGSPAYKQRVEQLSSILAAGTQGKTVDWTGVKAEAARELREIRILNTRPVSPLARVLSPGLELQSTQPASGRAMILHDIMNMKDNPTFQDVQALRSKWMGIGPQNTELLSNEAQGAAKHYIQSATEVLDNAVANDPIAKARWNAFRNFTRRGAEVLESSNINSLVNGDPEKVALSVGANDVTKARQIKRAVLGYAQNYGPTNDAAAAQSAWDKFRGAYIRQNLLTGDLGTLTDRIAKSDPVIKVIFNDAKGQSTIANLKLIGDAMQKMDTVTERGVGTRWQVLKGIPAEMVVKLAYNPSATRFFVRGLNGLMQDSRYSAIRGVGKASAAITPYFGNAAADIMRALQMVNSVQEAFPEPQKSQGATQ